jgi:hypothetical protein
MESTLKTSTVVRLAVLWNDTVVSEQVINPKKGINIGSDKKCQLKVPDHGAIQGSYELFAPGAPDTPELQLDMKMQGWINRGSDRINLGGHQPSYLLNEGDYGMIKVIDDEDNRLAVFFKVLAQEPTRFAAPLLTSIESRFFAAFLFAMTLHLGILIMAFALKNYELAFNNLQINDRFTEVLTEKLEDDMPEEPTDEEEEEDVGKQAGGEEGKFGEEDKLDKSKVPTTDGEMVDKIKNVGLAKALTSSLMGRGALSSVFGNRDGFSDQLNAAMSGGDGELAIGHGAGGMGLRGTGSGGGGSGFGRIHGMGKIDTGGGRGTKASLGRRGKRKARFSVKKGAPSVGNFCKQADILRVVSARQKAITYCYEKELASNPELGGKVTLAWIISLDGSVKKIWVKGSSLKNGKVESCMTRTLKRARFTKPDGGMCQIQFPFVFNSGI